MSPDLYRESYQILKNRLHQLDARVAGPEADGTAVVREANAIQQEFSDRLLAIPLDDMESPQVSHFQSLRTETHKQLRLLATDAAFWRSAKQPETRSQRQQQLRDRLQTLIGYCEAAAGAV